MSARTPRVLLFEDSCSVREWLTYCLRQRGFDVEAHESARSLLAAGRLPEIDLVITDVVMPDIDGLEVLKFIKSGSDDVPVILISVFGAAADVDYLLAARVLGADWTFEKPINIDRLVVKITDLIDQRRR